MSFSLNMTSAGKQRAKRRAAELAADGYVPLPVVLFIIASIDGLSPAEEGALIRVTGHGHMPTGSGSHASAEIKVELVWPDDR